jgi:hypothetical protein
VGYYIRILTPSETVASVARANRALAAGQLAGKLKLETGADHDWTQALLSHNDGREIALIERSCASVDDLVADEIAEFVEEIAACKPESSAQWLAQYLPTVKTIYAFQLLSGTDHKNGWEILGTAKNTIFSEVGGINQADGEGFSDEEGYHILWQFSNSVKGPWWMGLLQNNRWVHFRMDLGNEQHRSAFFRGEVPEGVEISN